ncbi:MAG: sterol desaturase family protein, partial [Hyphomicrobium sp.]
MQPISLFGISEPILRFGAFALVFVVMALLEVASPKRKLVASKGRRWLTNLTIVGIGSLLVRLMSALAVPLVAIAAAVYAESQGFGLLNVLKWPPWLEVLLAVVVLDLAIWFQHWAAHMIPALWRLHQVHHADVDIDVTTAIRFHPIEIALSMLWKIVCVVALGVSPLAVLLFEIILNGCAMFNHANVALPQWLDRALRTFLVTPDMHRVHHSVIGRELNSNFGFNLSIWDRVFGTYT